MKRLNTLKISAVVAAGLLLGACGETKTTGIEPKDMADALHKVMESDRTVYTRLIVNRLAVKEKVIKASEHFDDDKALVLPAQMFRFGSELVQKRAKDLPDVNFSYSLQSLWPINKQNAPKNKAEKEGLKVPHLSDHTNAHAHPSFAFVNKSRDL